MIQKKDFAEGKEYIYSDFGVKSYVTIQLNEITKTRKDNFWFTAYITDNSHYTGSLPDRYAIGTLHSFSNSFIYRDEAEMKIEDEKYKKVQIRFLTMCLANEIKQGKLA